MRRPSIHTNSRLRAFEEEPDGKYVQYLDVELPNVQKQQLVCLQDDIRRTPLYYAAANGHKEIIELLLKKGARKNAVDRDGWTAVHAAARYSHLYTLRCGAGGGAYSARAESECACGCGLDLVAHAGKSEFYM